MNARSQTRSWLAKLARAGYATKGTVYALTGGLAVLSVMTASGSVGGSRNAVESIGSAPFGSTLLILLAIGLFGYATWRFIQAALDPEDAQSDKGGTIKRIGYAISGAIHAGLGVAAVQMSDGGSGGSGGGATYLRDLVALDTVGPALAFIAGAAIIGYAIYDVYKAVTTDFEEKMKTSEMSATQQRWTRRIAQAGLTARAIVFAIAGSTVIQAAFYESPSEVQGFGASLREVASQPYGAVLLTVVATGLLAYGAYQVTLSRYRRLPA